MHGVVLFWEHKTITLDLEIFSILMKQYKCGKKIYHTSNNHKTRLQTIYHISFDTSLSMRVSLPKVVNVNIQVVKAFFMLNL